MSVLECRQGAVESIRAREGGAESLPRVSRGATKLFAAAISLAIFCEIAAGQSAVPPFTYHGRTISDPQFSMLDANTVFVSSRKQGGGMPVPFDKMPLEIQRQLEATRAAAKQAGAELITGKVFQVMSDGLLIDPSPSAASECEAIPMIFLADHPRRGALVEGSKIAVMAVRIGTHNYTTLLNTPATLPAWAYRSEAGKPRSPARSPAPVFGPSSGMRGSALDPK